MTPAENFEAFDCFQFLTSLSDDQLCAALAGNLHTQSPIAYEDALTEVVIRWLQAMTDVPWIRGFQNGPRPNEALKPAGGTRDGQYGTVWLSTSRPEGHTPIRYEENFEVDGAIQRDRVEKITQLRMFEFQLDVYRESGRGAQQQDGPLEQQVFARSAIDVLHHAELRQNHPMFRQALRQYDVQLGDFPIRGVRNLPQELVQSTFESRANANLVVYGCATSSIRLPTFDPTDTEIGICEDAVQTAFE